MIFLRVIEDERKMFILSWSLTIAPQEKINILLVLH